MCGGGNYHFWLISTPTKCAGRTHQLCSLPAAPFTMDHIYYGSHLPCIKCTMDHIRFGKPEPAPIRVSNVISQNRVCLKSCNYLQYFNCHKQIHSHHLTVKCVHLSRRTVGHSHIIYYILLNYGQCCSVLDAWRQGGRHE